jgi:hypothetical protein
VQREVRESSRIEAKCNTVQQGALSDGVEDRRSTTYLGLYDASKSPKIVITKTP